MSKRDKIAQRLRNSTPAAAQRQPNSNSNSNLLSFARVSEYSTFGVLPPG
jgi:hypothetical protein